MLGDHVSHYQPLSACFDLLLPHTPPVLRFCSRTGLGLVRAATTSSPFIANAIEMPGFTDKQATAPAETTTVACTGREAINLVSLPRA